MHATSVSSGSASLWRLSVFIQHLHSSESLPIGRCWKQEVSIFFYLFPPLRTAPLKIESLQFSVLVRIAPRSRCCRRPFVSVLQLSPRSPHHSIGLFWSASPLLFAPLTAADVVFWSSQDRRRLQSSPSKKKSAALPQLGPTWWPSLTISSFRLYISGYHLQQNSLVAFVLVRLGWHEQ